MIIHYLASFVGTTRGAIGQHYPIKAFVQAENETLARLELYNDYDHIQHLQLTECPVRYVVTHINHNGERTLSHSAQGRLTYETAAEAQAWIHAAILATSDETLRQIYGPQALGTFEVREVPCYPGHFDPVTSWFPR